MKKNCPQQKVKKNKNYFPLNPHFEKEITILLLELI